MLFFTSLETLVGHDYIKSVFLNKEQRDKTQTYNYLEIDEVLVDFFKFLVYTVIILKLYIL